MRMCACPHACRSAMKFKKFMTVAHESDDHDQEPE